MGGPHVSHNGDFISPLDILELRVPRISGVYKTSFLLINCESQLVFRQSVHHKNLQDVAKIVLSLDPHITVS